MHLFILVSYILGLTPHVFAAFLKEVDYDDFETKAEVSISQADKPIQIQHAPVDEFMVCLTKGYAELAEKMKNMESPRRNIYLKCMGAHKTKDADSRLGRIVRSNSDKQMHEDI